MAHFQGSYLSLWDFLGLNSSNFDILDMRISTLKTNREAF